MTLVDTSVWIDYLRGRARARSLGLLLEAGDVLVHPFVLGELALGTKGAGRDEMLGDMKKLPAAPRADGDDLLRMVEARDLAGSGIGWVDAHLLASALEAHAALWTQDGTLANLAAKLGIPGGPPA